jgi:hypothetical protein
VNRTKCDDPHDEEIESPLREIEAVFSLHNTLTFYIYALDM